MKKIHLILLVLGFPLWNCAPSWQKLAGNQFHLAPSEYQFLTPPIKKDLLGSIVRTRFETEPLSVEDLNMCATPIVKRSIHELSSYQSRDIKLESPRLEKVLPGPPSDLCFLQDGSEYQLVTEQLITKQFSQKANWYSKQMTPPQEELTVAVRLQKAKVHLKETTCEVKEGEACLFANLVGKIEVLKVEENGVFFDLSSSTVVPAEFFHLPVVSKLCASGKNHLSINEGCYFYPNEYTAVSFSLVKENNQFIFLISLRSFHLL